MKKFNLFSINKIIFISFIFVESFFFTLRLPASMIPERGESYIALNRFTVFEIIISITVLFLFSVILLYLIGFIAKRFLLLNKTLEALIISFALGLSFKIVFDAADYSWFFVGYRNFYPLLNENFLVNYFSFFWFIIPFLLSLFILLLLNNTEKLYKFINSFAVVFFCIMIWQTYSLASLHSSLSAKKDSIEAQNLNKKKVLWILFDGFDPGIAFSELDNPYEMSNFESLKKQSVHHSKMYPPAKDTYFSIPGMLMGKNVYGSRYEDYKFSILDKNGEKIGFNKENSIFGTLENRGLSSTITGTGFHSYCKLIKVNECEVFNEPIKWYDGILHITHYKLFKVHFLKIGSHRDINPPIIKKMFEYINSEDPTNFLFVHNRVPHLCHKCVDGFSGMGQRQLSSNPKINKKILNLYEERTEGYLINLKFVDFLVGKIFEDLKKNNDKYLKGETLIILSSDHWSKEQIDFKTRKFDANKPYPSLFFAKILGDDSKFELSEPDSSIHVSELIDLFFQDKINDHSDINNFFKMKNGYQIYFSKDIKFINEGDLN